VIWLWIGFIGFVLLILFLDLGFFHREAHVVTIKEAIFWSAVWISMGLAFSVFIYFAYDGQWFGLGYEHDLVDRMPLTGWSATEKYITGYVVEKSLSVDNIFVIAMIFNFFAVPAMYQHRVLFWGILGALVMRGVMIGLGAVLIAQFHWILYVFGAFLILTALKMLFMSTEHVDPDMNFVVRMTRRLFPVTARFHGEHFFVRAGTTASQESEIPGQATVPDEAVNRAKPGALMLTPMALALVMVETTDLIFAIDSIPAVFAITADPFLVFTSNIFAILGLRSLFFALTGMLDTFRYLKVSLALVLLVVGLKMFFADWLKERIGANFNMYLLGVVVLILALGVIASVVLPKHPVVEHDMSQETK
jgi:tellurite resistance protein TerC